MVLSGVIMRFIGLEFKESSPDNVVAKFCPDKIPEIRRVVVPLFPTFKVEAVDPTAAGDCFTGVLVKQYAETKDIVASARYASAAAAISVQHLGAQPSLPTKEAIDEFIAARS